MSSSNLVRVTFIEESTLGTTPGAGDFSTARFISESLSGSPETTESAQIRSDRMSSGQVVTGLTVGGELNFELAKEDALDAFFASGMMNTWNTHVAVTVDLSINGTTKEITRATGNWNTDVVVGDILTLSGFSNAANNTQVQVVEIVSNTIIKVVANGVLVTEVDTNNQYKRADKLTIGAVKKSFSMEKAFLDLTNKALIYRGMLVNTLSFNIAYGSIITGAIGFSGTDYENADAAIEFITNARTIDAAATTNSLNGSVDMPFVISSATGLLDEVTFCIQSLELSLNNNHAAQNCIGEAAPVDYSPGTAQIEVNMSAYLADANWSVLAQKLTQTPFALGFMVKNNDGWYGFYLPAVQVSFDDPASAGQNQQISLSMRGVAKVGSSGESSLTIFKSA